MNEHTTYESRYAIGDRIEVPVAAVIRGVRFTEARVFYDLEVEGGDHRGLYFDVPAAVIESREFDPSSSRPVQPVHAG